MNDKKILVVAVRRSGNPMTRRTYKVFKTYDEAMEYIKELDKEKYLRIRIYEELEVIEL